MPYANRVDWVFERGFLERADSRGIAKIPLFPSTCFVAARGGVGVGFIETAHSWRWKEDRYRIWIQDVRDLEIQVVDRLGRPVQGAPVCVLGYSLLWRGKTKGKEGIAKARVPVGYIRENSEVEVAFAFPFPWSEPKLVSLNRPSNEPVRLVLPSCGSFGIRLKGKNGKPWSRPVYLSLEVGKGNKRVFEVRRVQGKTYFPMIGLGCRIVAGPEEHGDIYYWRSI
ncbi:MAG TPA: hypothetical protein ENJ97_01755, partial [Planctomycetes bacterium]|nr:hypothetical protein [Planctomycetota bacterium]